MPRSVYWPLRHMSHSPTAQFGQGTGSGRRTMPTTRSPCFRPLDGPGSRTRPSDSWPSTRRVLPGGAQPYLPSAISISVPQTPAATASTNTEPFRMSGSGNILQACRPWFLGFDGDGFHLAALGRFGVRDSRGTAGPGRSCATVRSTPSLRWRTRARSALRADRPRARWRQGCADRTRSECVLRAPPRNPTARRERPHLRGSAPRRCGSRCNPAGRARALEWIAGLPAPATRRSADNGILSVPTTILIRRHDAYQRRCASMRGDLTH